MYFYTKNTLNRHRYYNLKHTLTVHVWKEKYIKEISSLSLCNLSMFWPLALMDRDCATRMEIKSKEKRNPRIELAP
jgi:hypothetical protein